jgi:putative Mg2+ transporter-C (MgtC) family protein
MSNADQFEFALWVLLATGLGAAVGLQRELRGHQAGIRTAALVAGGAAMFGRLSEVYGDDRIAAGVVQGIGFLGAGLILHRHGGVVRGATTAATIWVVAAVGLVVGRELWLAALVLTAAYIAVLELRPLSDMVFRFGQRQAAARGERTEEHIDQS